MIARWLVALVVSVPVSIAAAEETLFPSMPPAAGSSTTEGGSVASKIWLKTAVPVNDRIWAGDVQALDELRPQLVLMKNPSRIRQTSALRVKMFANRLFLTAFFGRPVVLPLHGTCDHSQIPHIFIGAKSEYDLVSRFSEQAGSSMSYICYPVETDLTENTIVIRIPKFVDADQLIANLLSARSDAGLLKAVAVESYPSFSSHIVSIPLGIEIDRGRGLDYTQRSLSRLAGQFSRFESEYAVEFSVPFR
jgi:hypothetical protein